MHIDKIHIQNFRTFEDVTVDFIHPRSDFAALGIPKPKLNNINLVLGNNGSGKTTLLKAIAIAALGPTVTYANLPVYKLIRQSVSPSINPGSAAIDATFAQHPQDLVNSNSGIFESRCVIEQRGDIEIPSWGGQDDSDWNEVYSNASDAFFYVGYGATRRVESKDIVDPASRQSSSLVRAQRIRSIFEEAYSLIPFSSWLPALEISNPGRFVQVMHIIDRLLENTGYKFTGTREDGEYLFEHDGLGISFPALSDGYRAYLGWIADLLYHVCFTCPSGSKLVDNFGMVMIDEIDLHLHPSWQITVLPTLSAALPNVQFIVTSHSPLVVGSLEWMNIIVIGSGPLQANTAKRIAESVHGLDADQILLTDFFDMESTRASDHDKLLKVLSIKATKGDADAALQLISAMSSGSEASE